MSHIPRQSRSLGAIIWNYCGKASLRFSEALAESLLGIYLKSFRSLNKGSHSHTLDFDLGLEALDSFNAEKYKWAGKTGGKRRFYQPNQQILVSSASPPDSACKLHGAFFRSPLSSCALLHSVRRNQMALSTFCLEISLSYILKFIRYISYLSSFHGQHFANYSITHNTCCPFSSL